MVVIKSLFVLFLTISVVASDAPTTTESANSTEATTAESVVKTETDDAVITDASPLPGSDHISDSVTSDYGGNAPSENYFNPQVSQGPNQLNINPYFYGVFNPSDDGSSYGSPLGNPLSSYPPSGVNSGAGENLYGNIPNEDHNSGDSGNFGNPSDFNDNNAPVAIPVTNSNPSTEDSSSADSQPTGNSNSGGQDSKSEPNSNSDVNSNSGPEPTHNEPNSNNEADSNINDVNGGTILNNGRSAFNGVPNADYFYPSRFGGYEGTFGGY